MRRRLLLAPVTLLVVALGSFLVLELVPGDAAQSRLGLDGSDVSRQALRVALGLDGGVVQRATTYLTHLAHLDLGRSLVDGRPVRERLAERLPMTALLALLALSSSWLIGLPLAVLRSVRTTRGLDLLMAFTYALPLPALAIALLAAGAPYGRSLGGLLAAAACLAPLLVPRIYAQASRALDEVAASDAQRTLRASGATPARRLAAALHMRALGLVTLASLQLPALLSGAVLVETIFGLPGLGLLAVDALATRDQPVLLGLVLLGAALSIGALLLVDLLAPILDPTLRERS